MLNVMSKINAQGRVQLCKTVYLIGIAELLMSLLRL